MKRINLKLRTKIAMLNILVVSISLVVTIIFIYQMRISGMRKDAEINLMNISKSVARSPTVINSLKNNEDSSILKKYLDDVLQATKNIDSIIIMDLSGNRYGSLKGDTIKKKSFKKLGINHLEGRVYVEDRVESFGKLLICFVKVNDENNQVIGFVTSKVLTENVEGGKYETITFIILVILSGLLIGSVGALIISKSVKESLLGYEAEQISKLFIQKQEVLDALNEGIIAVDEKLKITFYNKTALTILKKHEEDFIGKDILNLISNSNLSFVLKDGQPQYNKEMIINDTFILTNRIPIKNKNKTIGAVTIFRDKTEVMKLAEEVTGVKQVVEALRANNHEFMNKLHVILGLIQINEIEEAKKYIIKQKKEQQQKISLVMNKIEDTTIAALMLGKISRAKELGVDLFINSESNLNKFHGKINSNALVTIIGNLLENSIESVSLNEKQDKIIEIFINESNYELIIRVKDTGGGIEKDKIHHIFQSGFSTKGENRGKGLSLVKEVIKNLDGKIKVFSQIGDGAEFLVNIPKGDKND
ncbi:ATP-binding protein [Clostridium rectalis]|uniref:ATP-binding protein n=1 Tax=Clostridium rectalis TaxID=2040295 RepID=UPI000F6401A0|nr:ATP-binding protein [Clostridium rectalis]